MHGLPTHLSVHVGGVIVGTAPLTDSMTLQQSAKGVVISSFDKDDIEALGFVKLDILSLRTLAVVNYAVQLVEQQHGKHLEVERLPLDVPQVFALLRSSNTVGDLPGGEPGTTGAAGADAGQASTLTSSAPSRSSARAPFRATWWSPLSGGIRARSR